MASLPSALKTGLILHRYDLTASFHSIYDENLSNPFRST